MRSPVLSGLIALVALGASDARAQIDINAGMSPAQLFAANCAACHRSPQGLGRGRDVNALAHFLRDHYTTRPTNAGAIAAYLMSARGTAPARPPAAQESPGAGEGAVQASRTPPVRPIERLAHATIERLKPFAASADAATPADANAPEGRNARVAAFANSGASADLVRETAVAAALRNGRPVAGPSLPRAAAASTGELAKPPAAVPADAVRPMAPRPGRPALSLPGPPPTSAMPAAQSNEDTF